MRKAIFITIQLNYLITLFIKRGNWCYIAAFLIEIVSVSPLTYKKADVSGETLTKIRHEMAMDMINGKDPLKGKTIQQCLDEMSEETFNLKREINDCTD